MTTIDLSRTGTRAEGLLRRIGAEADHRGFRLWLVGGAVRDLLLARPTTDLDVVLEADAQAFARELAALMPAKAVTHSRFLTAVLTFEGGLTIDLVTARTEIYPHPGSLPVVVPATIVEDLRRRDFTINTLAAGLNAAAWGALRDDTGAMADLEQRLVRVLHPKSFIDDPTRLLRAARYAARFGFTLEPATARALEDAVARDVFTNLTAPRYFLELRRILQEPDPVPALDLLSDWGALLYVPYGPQERRLLEARTGDWQQRLGGLLATVDEAETQTLLAAFNLPRDSQQKVIAAQRALQHR